MKRSILMLSLGFILAQSADYAANEAVDVMQKKCYPLWTDGQAEKYQKCMQNQKTLSFISDILGFNFIYSGRKNHF